MSSETTDYTILLCGPAAHRHQVVTGLRQAGIRLADGDPQHSWGHPEGLTPGDPTVGWVTVHGAHPDVIPASVASLGWGLRAHWPTTGPAVELEVVPAGTADRLDRLEKLLGVAA